MGGFGRALIALIAVAAVSACGGSLRLVPSGTLVRKPANVVVLFRLDGPEGPVPDLGAEAFRVTEGGFEIAPGPDLDISRPDLSSTLRLLVLLDFGGHPNDAEREALVGIARTLVSRLSPIAQLAIYVFDGAPKPEVVVEASQAKDAEGKLKRLSKRKSADASTDLHGALLTAIKTLQLKSDPPEPRAGMLVLVSRGPDRAARVRQREVRDQLAESDMAVSRFVLQLGPRAANLDYGWLATQPTQRLDNPAKATETAQAVADRMLAVARSHYLLSYCSAARSGQHEVKITASHTVQLEDGESETLSGKLTYSFEAGNFGPGCKPWKPRRHGR